MSQELSISLKSLVIEDFRGFGYLSIDFDSQLTMLIAQNGGGKTTILDAVAESLKYFLFESRLYSESPKQNVSALDVKNGTYVSLCKLKCELAYTVVEKGEKNTNERGEEYYEEDEYKFDSSQCEFGFQLKKNDQLAFFYDKNDENRGFENYKTHVETLYREGESLPILVYYGSQQANKVIVGSLEKKNIDRYYIYNHALDKERFDFNSFYTWFKNRENVVLSTNEEDRHFLLLKEAILDILNDDDDDKLYSALGMSYQKDYEALIVTKDIAGKREGFEVSQMSAGEKHIFAMVGDIAIRLIEANPSSENPLKEGFGIVLIDEIDLHLHPKWQLKVVTKLREIFPNVQFVITTHSPLVLNHLDSKYIRSLESGKVYGVSETKGQSVDVVLEDVMGTTHASMYKSEFDNLYEAITKNDIDNAKVLLKELELKIEGKHPEIVKLNSLITKKEILKK